MLSSLGELPATFEQLIHRTPADRGWWQGGLYHEDMGWGVQALWFNTWYDVSIGPNLEQFNHARKVGHTAEVRDNQYQIIAPVFHIAYQKIGRDACREKLV